MTEWWWNDRHFWIKSNALQNYSSSFLDHSIIFSHFEMRWNDFVVILRSFRLEMTSEWPFCHSGMIWNDWTELELRDFFNKGQCPWFYFQHFGDIPSFRSHSVDWWWLIPDKNMIPLPPYMAMNDRMTVEWCWMILEWCWNDDIL